MTVTRPALRGTRARRSSTWQRVPGFGARCALNPSLLQTVCRGDDEQSRAGQVFDNRFVGEADLLDDGA